MFFTKRILIFDLIGFIICTIIAYNKYKAFKADSREEEDRPAFLYKNKFIYYITIAFLGIIIIININILILLKFEDSQ